MEEHFKGHYIGLNLPLGHIKAKSSQLAMRPERPCRRIDPVWNRFFVGVCNAWMDQLWYSVLA